MTTPPDFTRSPHTGWTREHWELLADRMLTAVGAYRSPAGARIDLPGPASISGSTSDGLEGFARTFLIAGFLTAGRGGDDPRNYLEGYARGLAAGTDPSSPEAWPRPDDGLHQAKVEAASIALTLQATRPWLWDRLDDRVRERTVDWLSAVLGQWYPQSNWTWFRIIVESFLREVGGPWSATEIGESLALHASLRRPNGWLADGHGRLFDHYNGWALHLYPMLWTRLFDVTGTLCPQPLRDQWAADLARYTEDVLCLIGADGSPLLQGRSLTYRFAAAAPLWVSAITGSAHPPGLLRRAASGIVSHFVTHDALEPDGLLSLGWHGPWPRMRQSYSGPGSPYWAAKGLLGLLLPSDHAVWTDTEQALPVETGDIARVVEAPGWLVSARRSDGIVTVLNHGTDTARPGEDGADSPLYSRLGYSTATLPPLTGRSVADPVDNSVVLLDADDRASHRSGFRTLFTRELGDGVLVAASQGPVRWIDPASETGPNSGTGPVGAVTPGPVLTVASVVRGPIEVRLARVDSPTSAEARLRIGGWPVTSSEALRSESDTGQERAFASTWRDDLRSFIHGVRGLDEAGIAVEQGSSPLGEYVAVPWLATRTVPVGDIVAAVVGLSRQPHVEPAPLVTVTDMAGQGHRIAVSWSQGETTEFVLPIR